MRFWRRKHYSAGIPVPVDTHRKIAAGDRARDARRWQEAATLYGQAIAEQPDLFHIRIQLGHALKETERLREAEEAYRAAHAARPGEREGVLHLAHVLKMRGAIGEAAERYVSLAIADPDDEEAMREARDAIACLDADRRQELAIAIGANVAADARDEGYPSIGTCRIVYDASGLLTYFRGARWPTGIQRVQIETLVQALEQSMAGGERVGVCAFVDGREEWVGIPSASFLALARLSGESEGADAAEWRHMRDRLYLRLIVTPSFEFAPGAVLVNLGTSWALRNYFLHVRDAQVRRGVIFIPMIYDMIPAMFPDFCIDALVQDFINWSTEVFHHTSSFLAISEASKKDLIAAAACVGYEVPLDNVEVVPLNADFEAANRATSPPEAAPVADDTPFILFVSTIEPRKGHLVAFDAWSLLIDRLGADKVPRLICVGRNGWRNAAIFDRLTRDPVLRTRVSILADLSDAALAELYEASLFTIYPSLYEGWGLPITEALCRGKVVITTTSSSLPEAGGEFAFFIPPGDPVALADETQRMIEDPAALLARETLIAERFRPTGWGAIADQIGRSVISLSERALDDPQTAQRRLPPVARIGSCYWLCRTHAMTLRRSVDTGEAFRAGLGWHPPEDRGCRVGRHGGLLAMRVAADEGAPGDCLSITLRLVGSEDGPCTYRITGGAGIVQGDLGRLERLSVTVDAVVSEDGRLDVTIESSLGRRTAEEGPADPMGCTTMWVECLLLRRKRQDGKGAERQSPVV